MEFHVRPMRVEDLPFLRALAEARGRNIHDDEYARFLELEGGGGIVMTVNDEIVGAATVFRCFEHAILGPLIIGEKMSIALGVELVHQVIERMQRDAVTRIEVEASEDETLFLSRMGFEPLHETVVLERPAGPRSEPADEIVKPLELRHFLDLGPLDGAAFGYGRKDYFAALFHEMPEAAFVLEAADADDVDGFVFLRAAKRGRHLGPLVTRRDNLDDARALLGVAVARACDEPLVALVPEGSTLLPHLESEGFRAVGRLTRLRAGEAPDKPEATEWLVGSRLTG